MPVVWPVPSLQRSVYEELEGIIQASGARAKSCDDRTRRVLQDVQDFSLVQVGDINYIYVGVAAKFLNIAFKDPTVTAISFNELTQ